MYSMSCKMLSISSSGWVGRLKSFHSPLLLVLLLPTKKNFTPANAACIASPCSRRYSLIFDHTSTRNCGPSDTKNCVEKVSECQQQSACETFSPGCYCGFMSFEAGYFDSEPNEEVKGGVNCWKIQGEDVDNGPCSLRISYDECIENEYCQWDGPRPTSSPTKQIVPTKEPTNAPTRLLSNEPTPGPVPMTPRPTPGPTKVPVGKCVGTREGGTCTMDMFYETCDSNLSKRECEDTMKQCKEACPSSLRCECDKDDLYTTTEWLPGNPPIPFYTFTYAIKCSEPIGVTKCDYFEEDDCGKVNGCYWVKNSSDGLAGMFYRGRGVGIVVASLLLFWVVP
ncbi:hypothetical protein ACHAXS_007380 [Conticribra weissflogii]